jgi:hypothetical protein
VLRHLPIIEVLAVFIGNIVCVHTATIQNERQQSVNRASTEHQQSVNRASTERQQSVNRAPTEHQQSINRASTERQQSANRASTEHQQSLNRASTEHQQSIYTAPTECQQSVNDVGCCIWYNPRAVLQHLPIIEVLAAFIGNMVCGNSAAPQASMELPQFLIF